jgi:hypothetical protein
VYSRAPPLVALGLHLSGVPNAGSDYRAVAQTVERVWRAHIDQPLRIVGSTTFVNGIVSTSRIRRRRSISTIRS